MDTRSNILKHLNEDYTEPIRDPIWKHIYLTKPLINIIQSRIFQKLNRIKQLGPTYLIYPGATHTRYNHSLGVFHLAKKMITKLILKKKECNFSILEVKAFLCAALLHDLGHFPFAHSLKDLNIIDHEVLTGENILKNTEIYKLIENSLLVPPYLVAAIVDENLTKKNFANLDFFRNLLSGVLDPDKLDYLNRDAYFCGVPYGIQDIDFIFNEISLNSANDICISHKGLPSVENILFSKYLMYKHIYWHKKVRIITAMIKKAIFSGLSENIIYPDDLYGIDDEEFSAKMKAHTYPPFSMIIDALFADIYNSVYCIPFNKNNPLHCKIENLKERSILEAKISKKIESLSGFSLKPHEIIIDIPENISFEIDVSIIDETNIIPYNNSGSVFSENVVKGFCRSLRHISVLVKNNVDLINFLHKNNINELFKNFLL